jgi:hypothetical protein
MAGLRLFMTRRLAADSVENARKQIVGQGRLFRRSIPDNEFCQGRFRGGAEGTRGDMLVNGLCYLLLGTLGRAFRKEPLQVFASHR